jgi:hypothetical protein
MANTITTTIYALKVFNKPSYQPETRDNIYCVQNAAFYYKEAGAHVYHIHAIQ